MRAADIPDEEFESAVRTVGAQVPSHWAFSWDVAEYMRLPSWVVRAKAMRFIAAGRMGGCWCGCRGDWIFPDDMKPWQLETWKAPR